MIEHDTKDVDLDTLDLEYEASAAGMHLQDLLPVQVRCGHCQDVGTVAYHSVDEVFVCAMRSQQPGFTFVTLPEIQD